MKASAVLASPPTAPAAPVAAVDSTAAAAADTADTGNNFVGMLMQLLGGNAPSSLTAATTTTKAVDTEADAEDPTALAAMLAMPLPAPLPWNALPAATSGNSGDPLELLGLGSGSGSNTKTTDLAALLALKSDDSALDDAAAPATPDTNDSIGSLSPLTDLTAAKVTQPDVPASKHVQAPVGSPQWADELGSKLSLMVDRNEHSASLKLSPDHLGPLEVRISITDDKASVWFGAAHADTRAAIEHALPRLREMLASTGLSLGDTGVFREPPRDQQAPASRNFTANSENSAPETEMLVSTRSLSLLDAYA
jgi:flagellar hook-length control protein FliK